MNKHFRNSRPTLGVLAGWQFYRTATNLSYLAPIFRGVCRAAQDFGCNVLLGCGLGPSASPDDPLRPAWPFTSSEHDFVPVGPENTDGLIIASPLHSVVRSQYIQKLVASGYPVIFIGSGEPGPSVIADNASGVLQALQHLKNHGHQQIAFIAGSLDDMNGDTGDRLRAYQFGCELFGLDQNPRLVSYGRHVYDGGYLAMQQTIGSGLQFTAVLASNDESALGAMKALEEAGRKIPQDVAIIGFDNRLEGAINQPGLSSVHIPLSYLGYSAVELMLKHLQGGEPLAERTQVETRLVVRESCGCNSEGTLSSIIKSDQLPDVNLGEQDFQLASTISIAIKNQAQHLTQEECMASSQRLVTAFAGSLRSGDHSQFRQVLIETLQLTAAGDDDPYIWQAALSVLEKEIGASFDVDSALAAIQELISDGRLTISTQMHHQYGQHTASERWNASRLSLLTTRLLTALDENQIYEILWKYLPTMNIRTAMVALFEAEGEDPFAWSSMRNMMVENQPAIRFPSLKFPPEGLFDPDKPFQLVLIPVVDPSGQSGFMIFDLATGQFTKKG